jgi:hypothetical protein
MNGLSFLHLHLRIERCRVAALLVVITWLPLLVLSAIQGLLWSRAEVPFLKDLGVQSRFLLATPALVLGELPLVRRLRESVGQFLRSDFVRERDRKQFARVATNTFKLRNSRSVQIALIALACGSASLNFLQSNLREANTWAAPVPTAHWTLAGYWYLLLALPILQFLIYRWLYFAFLWAVLLWRISRLRLELSAAHPDGAAGLAFLGKSLVPFGTVGFALGAILSGVVATRLFLTGASLKQFLPVYAALVVIQFILFVGPLLFFTPKMIRLKHKEMMKYEAVVSRRTRFFERSWGKSRETDSTKAPIQESTNIPSLADVRSSFELVRKMRVVVVVPRDLIILAIPTLFPGLPLIATVIPMNEIARGLLHLIA